jgi:hypothetical protein
VTVADNAAFLSGFPDLRATPPTRAGSTATADATTTASEEPLFRSLYQPGARTEPVSSAVQELWGNRASLTTDTTQALSQQPTLRVPNPLDLFSDRAGTFSG